MLQVAGKIAADLTPKTDSVMDNITSFSIAFEAVSEVLLNAMGMTVDSPNVALLVTDAFPGAVVVAEAPIQYAKPATQYAPAGGGVRIKGTQHGPLPAWLASECAKKGVTEVWDNRDGLAENAKRPWFKATTGTDAFWEPKARR